MEISHSHSRYRNVLQIVLASICTAMVIVAVTLAWSLPPLTPRASFDPVWKLKHSVPLVHLRKNLISSDDNQVRSQQEKGRDYDQYALRTPVFSSSPGLSSGFQSEDKFKNQSAELKKFGINVSGGRRKLERGLAGARAAINRAASSGVYPAKANVYRNPGAFYQSYKEMERRFKVYVYTEGDLPISHDGPCKNIYSTEGRFIQEMENGAKRFRTTDAELAHVYFMPFSVTWMVKYLYKPNSHDQNPLRRYVSDYVKLISLRYPFWNSTKGADHFMVACHDWGPHASEGNPYVYNTSIRGLCNANSSEGFNPQKDVSLPEIHLLTGEIPQVLLSPPPENATRPQLAFFAGGLHGPIRPVLLRHWKEKNDSLIRVYEYLPEGLDYHSFILQSKFCICPSGFEVASPRIVEAIYAECVPVIMSESYVLPFSDVLNWDAFSIKVEVSDIPRLKEILSSVPEEKYRRLKEGLKVVRKHFVFNQPAKSFDAFHMILHSIWLRRINVGLP